MTQNTLLSRDMGAGMVQSDFSRQLELEMLFNKNQLIPRIRNEFENCKEFDFAAYMEEHEIPVDFGFSLLVQMALHKRTTLPTLVGILRHHFEDEGDNASQATTDMLLRAAEIDLVDWDPLTEQFIVKFTISEQVQKELDLFQYPLPMVVKPREVKHNKDSAHLLSGDGSLILRKNHHEDDICLDHINRANAIKFAINHDVVRMVKNKWRNLDKPKEGESKAEFEKRCKAFEKYDRSSKEVIQILGPHADGFYLTHKYDKRGRVYCQGYHVNYQGAPWNKAVIELADKEIVP